MELCGWGRGIATSYTYGVGMAAGGIMPDLENAGCIVFWGYNPSLARLAHATATVAALKRGARLIVVDPRRAGLASKADVWLRVRPGSDGALALGIANVMIERSWYDQAFVRDWTNGPFLVRADTERLLTERDLSPDGSAQRYVAWETTTQQPVLYDPALGRYERDDVEPALFGKFTIPTLRGPVICRPVFDLAAELCARYLPEAVQSICWVERDQVERAARLLWEARPVAYYSWSGVEQHSSSTQIARAISFLYALTGSFDAPGGNVQFAAVPTPNVTGDQLLSSAQRAKALGLGERPLGPSRTQWVTTDELYRAILDHEPYAVRGLVGFGANLLLAHAGVERGREALRQLEFYVHADLFMNPTAELADIVLPVATPFEREGLKIGFEVSPAAQSLVQLRRRVVAPRGEARSDTEIIFDLACRLGLGAHFWDGDIDAAYRHQLGLSGVSLEALRENPAGVRVPLKTRYRKYAERDDGAPKGFATPTRKVEVYSELFVQHGYPPLPVYEEPLVGPLSRPEYVERFPLILTCAKDTQFCESQHRGLPSLRRRAPHPDVELHPAAAKARGIAEGDWVAIESPDGSVRARARLNADLDPRVVVGEHGFWQRCDETGASGYDPFGPASASYNLLIGTDVRDPVSGTPALRSYLCEIRPAADTPV
jgi:anaerobic selenocysteine-containing dehydrogenase